MEQLKMYWLPGTSIKPVELPEGYSISNYSKPSDRTDWCTCCKNGLLEDDADEKKYVELIENVTEIDQYRDVFFLDYEGVHIGTVTAYMTHAKTGDVHMVGLIPAHRGKGLGKILVRLALEHLETQNPHFVTLTTDEWRDTAVYSYLHEGFLPVEYDIGMQDRWEDMLEKLKIDDEITMLYEDATVFRKICRRSKAPVVRFGVLGAGRGTSMMDYCRKARNAKLVAVCDQSSERLLKAKKEYGEENITFYEDFDSFLKEDMDCVVLANYANEHAPYAIACLKAGKHVLSEVLPVQTLKEAVELIDAVEHSDKLYAYAENYCYMPAPKKMRQLYQAGALGKFEYGEGEYMHNCESEWHRLTFANPEHWRNNMSAFYYCTHSIGPLLHITGLRPVKVVGFEAPFNDRMERMGAKAGPFAVEMITLENGALIKSLHGVGPSRSSIWFSVYGSKGRMESAREDANNGYVTTLYTNCDGVEGGNQWCPGQTDARDALSGDAEEFGHGSSDYYVMYQMVQKIRGNRNADVISIFEAMDMFLPGLFAYRSVRNGGVPEEIPDFRDPEVRNRYRNDTECTDPKAAGEMLIPSYSVGNPEIPQKVYDDLAAVPQSMENNSYNRKHGFMQSEEKDEKKTEPDSSRDVPVSMDRHNPRFCSTVQFD